MPELERWKQAQIKALIAAGIDSVDAERALDWVLDHLPPGFEPDLYIINTANPRELLPSPEAIIADANADWITHTSSGYAMLLSPQDDDDRNGLATLALTLFVWDASRGVFVRRASGSDVSRATILRLLENRTAQAESIIDALTTAFHEGRLAPSVWQEQMATVLRRLHYQNAALGAGGFPNLQPIDILRIESRLLDDFGRLQNFADEIVRGNVSIAQALNRAGMYIGNSRTQFWEAERDRVVAPPGMVAIERRVLRAGESCEDCIGYYGEGWQYAGYFPAPGTQSRCRSNCKCGILRMNVPAGRVGEYIGTRS